MKSLCKKLTVPEAISLVAHQVCRLLEQKEKEFEWTKSHHGFATQKGLEEMEKRLTDAIAKHADITPSIVTAALLVQAALDKLDATIPDKQNGDKVC